MLDRIWLCPWGCMSPPITPKASQGSPEPTGEPARPGAGLLRLENGVPKATRAALAALGWPIGDSDGGFGGYQAIQRWPGRYAARVAFHRSCHSRGTDSVAAALTLLRSIAGLEVVEFGEAEQCCGFGGTFAVTFPHLSGAMGQLKLDHVRAAQPDVYVSGDMSCMMHLGGLAAREGRPIRTLHLSQVLRDALRGGEAKP